MNKNAAKWLSRFSFTNFIVAFLIGWKVWRIISHYEPPIPQWQVIVMIVGMILAFVLGMLGVRARHQDENWS